MLGIEWENCIRSKKKGMVYRWRVCRGIRIKLLRDGFEEELSCRKGEI